jgi:Ca2+-binding EF-hand superfamily protein
MESLKKIQEGVLMFIVNFLTNSEEKERLMLCFKTLDLDSDGSISKEELEKGFSRYCTGTEK